MTKPNTPETDISSSMSILSLNEIDGLIDTFTGSDGKSVKKWLSDFCDTVVLYGWSDDFKLRYCKRFLRGPAKHFVENEIKPKTFEDLQFHLIHQFQNNSFRTLEKAKSSFLENEVILNTRCFEKMYKNILVDGLPIKALIDTGSYYTLIRSDSANALLLDIQRFSKTITGLGTSIHIEGEVTCNIEIDDITFRNVKCYVVPVRCREPEVTIGSNIITTVRMTTTSKGIVFHPEDSESRDNGEDCALYATYVKEIKETEDIPLLENIQPKQQYESEAESQPKHKRKRKPKRFLSIYRFNYSLKTDLISSSLKRMTKLIIINYLTIDAYIDTGALVSLIADTYLEFLPDGYEIIPCKLDINDTALSKGYIIAKLEIDDIVIENVKLFVLSEYVMRDKVIIGADVITQADVTISSEGVTFTKRKI